MSLSTKFVEPEEKSTGYYFKRIYDENAGCFISKSVQSTFQLIPISKTLIALFSSPEFEKMYIDFNKSNVHNCGNGNFNNFCCGENYKRNFFFKSNPLAIQIKLFTDDFEPCDPLKSKVGVHKITAFYFQIVNLPSNWNSKIDSIYLLALSDASDSKNELADGNTLLEMIVADLKLIETKGIVTNSNTVFKGALACVSFDNLGGNLLFGFSGGFNAHYYCRICHSKRQDCQNMVKEDPRTVRTVSDYNKMVTKLQLNPQMSLIETKGIKSACALNTLNNFHIISHASVDLMHDVFEGVVGFLIEQVVNYLVVNKTASIEQLQALVQCYNYGYLSKRNIPSKLNIEKKNIGQNASQARCLFLHLPFIFFQFKDQVKVIWLAVESLLQIIQILLSDEICEDDSQRLSHLVTTHLQCYQLYFNQQLKPKHHLLLHYERIIRALGPVVKFWAMRMEAKHQYFKQLVHQTNNFVNIKKTLAMKHQQRFFALPTIFSDDIIFGKSVPFVECDDFDKYVDKLLMMGFSNETIQECQLVKSLKLNDRQYKQSLLISIDKHFIEIQFILLIQNQWLFLCDKFYDIICYDSFLNSLKVVSKEKYTILSLKDLKNNKSYEKKSVGGDIYVIADCLEIYKMKPE